MFKDFFKQSIRNKHSEVEENRIEYVTLEEIKDKAKSGILVLENGYFKIERIELDEDFEELEERDRELEIEAILEDRIKNYNPLDYIEKEIELKEKKEIVIILLERLLVDKILEEAKEKKVKILGVIPAFLLRALELKNNSNAIEKFIDIDRKNTVLVDIEDGKIKDIFSIEIDEEKILESEKEDILQYIFEIDLEDLNILSFYEKDREIGESFENIENIGIKINSWSNINKEYNYDYDFLPTDYLENLRKNKFIRKIVVISLVIFVLIVLLGFLFQYFLNEKSEKIENLERKVISYEDDIEKIKEKILEIDEIKKLREEEIKKIEFKNIKLRDILNDIDNFKPKGVKILNIELAKLNDRNKIKIIGESINEEKILIFQEKIVNSDKFKNINHDYIRKIEESYNFQLEAEVYLW